MAIVTDGPLQHDIRTTSSGIWSSLNYRAHSRAEALLNRAGFAEGSNS